MNLCCYVPWMCKQTCQVSLNLRESPEMAGDLQVSRKCKKISRNWGNLIDLYLQENIAVHYPPPHRIGSASGNYGHFCYSPQRTWTAYGEHGTFLLLPPPPPNLACFWRSRKLYRVASAGCPPKQKSWLCRWKSYRDIPVLNTDFTQILVGQSPLHWLCYTANNGMRHDFPVSEDVLWQEYRLYTLDQFSWSNSKWCRASGVKRPDFTYGTNSLESIPPIQVSERAYYNMASNGIKPHERGRKSQISVDGADRRIARIRGTRYGPLSTKLRYGPLSMKLQWHVALSCIVVVPRHAREEASEIVRSPMHSPLQMRRSIL